MHILQISENSENALTLAIGGVDTAEDGPSKVRLVTNKIRRNIGQLYRNKKMVLARELSKQDLKGGVQSFIARTYGNSDALSRTTVSGVVGRFPHPTRSTRRFTYP